MTVVINYNDVKRLLHTNGFFSLLVKRERNRLYLKNELYKTWQHLHASLITVYIKTTLLTCGCMCPGLAGISEALHVPFNMYFVYRQLVSRV